MRFTNEEVEDQEREENRADWLKDKYLEETDVMIDSDGDDYVMVLEENGYRKSKLPENCIPLFRPKR